LDTPRDVNFYRNEVLDAHLLLEDQINSLLELAFQIKLPRSMSNNYTKLDLLLDLGIIEEEFHDSFQLFSRIRNQFIHVLECMSFTDLPEKLRKRLLASQKISYDYLEDNDQMYKALKSLFTLLMEDFMVKIKMAMERGQSQEATLAQLRKAANDLLDYI